ncbi:MAG: hypothetical protein ACI3U8_00120 [Candidatus Onthomonas sp.]
MEKGNFVSLVLDTIGLFLLGIGMCAVWIGLMLPGILVGCVSIVLLLLLIPMCKGLR